jgi:DNA-binding NarL/FixJ family response regulator
MSADAPIRVLLVDDHPVVALGFHAAIARESQVQVLGTVSTRDEALERVRAARPDVVLVATSMDNGTGVELCADLRAVSAATRCLLYGARAEDRLVLDTVRAGAGGYVLTSSPLSRIPAAIRAVAAGESFLDPAVTQRLFEHLRQPAAADPVAFLSNSERELLRHLSLGLSNREIAARMYLSEKTVKNYVSRLLRKLDLSRRTEAVAFGAMLSERTRFANASEPDTPAPGRVPATTVRR